MRRIDDLFVEFKNRVRVGEKVLRNFFDVGIETDAEEGALRLNLIKDLLACQMEI